MSKREMFKKQQIGQIIHILDQLPWKNQKLQVVENMLGNNIA